MRRAVVLVAALAHLALPAAARAETYPLGDVRIEIPTASARAACLDRAGAVDVEMARCEGGEAAAWDRRLNAAWARLRATLPPAEFQRLQAAQRGWLAYREHECRDDGMAGTAGRVAAAACLVRTTAVRATELEARAAAEAR